MAKTIIKKMRVHKLENKNYKIYFKKRKYRNKLKKIK